MLKLLLLALVCAGGPALAGPYEDAFAAHSKGDYDTALRLYRPLAEQGNASAQHKLGVVYAKGQGVPQDYAAAVAWYRKAAQQGRLYYQIDLAFMYVNGRGVLQDYVLAHMFFNLSAATFSSPPWAETWGSAECAEETDLRWRCIAAKARDWAAARMTPAQIAEAEKLAQVWRPK